ncbi:hypothetical protein KIN20_020506 [Parelaphostrongylus tenuis]|uniref:Uncharacterized protein n=1 Tax=Parelaphostrongylus tenuis TaxID=148309 RepID=A0AAD5MMJ6_PARTN|nr:hypothetical protein KIN20_020506 [Parelaphostrongylus tenuis]
MFLGVLTINFLARSKTVKDEIIAALKELVILGFKARCMIDASELRFAQEVLQRPEKRRQTKATSAQEIPQVLEIREGDSLGQITQLCEFMVF